MGTYVTPRDRAHTRAMRPSFLPNILSARETEVLDCLYLGLDPSEAAKRLELADGVVRNYLRRMKSKMRVTSLEELLLKVVAYDFHRLDERKEYIDAAAVDRLRKEPTIVRLTAREKSVLAALVRWPDARNATMAPMLSM